jgi:beta-glucosidase/6-phospho-beta-glucosidase/beta-galactosidase
MKIIKDKRCIIGECPIWNEFEKRPGVMRDDVNGNVASDHYHRYKEDIDIMHDIGLSGYRFSFAWSRIFPEGRGKVNQKGVDHYKKVCETLLSKGIEPFVTLYHWDLPQALQVQARQAWVLEPLPSAPCPL